jgi:hypothetical protein
VKPDARKEYAGLVSNKISTALVSHAIILCEHIFKHSVNGMRDFNINIITGNIYKKTLTILENFSDTVNAYACHASLVILAQFSTGKCYVIKLLCTTLLVY